MVSQGTGHPLMMSLALKSSIEDQRIVPFVWIFPLYSDDKTYIKHCTLRERKDQSLWSYRWMLVHPYGSPWYFGCMGCGPLVDSWSLILLGLHTLIVCVRLPYGFYFFWYTLLYGFIYITFGPIYPLYCFWSLDLFYFIRSHTL